VLGHQLLPEIAVLTRSFQHFVGYRDEFAHGKPPKVLLMAAWLAGECRARKSAI
jgi:hypothetical protein